MIPCRVCSSQDSARLFTKDLLDIVRCENCGLIYTNTEPAVNELRAFYGEAYFRSRGSGTSYADYLREEQAMAITARYRLAALKKMRSPPGALLDVGCATGFFLDVARHEWDVEGVELSEYASSYARTERRLPVKTGTLRDAGYGDESFDVVTMWDVIEHLAKPLDDLAEARRILKPSGILVFSTGDAGSVCAKLCGKYWHLYNPDQHLSFFDQKTVEALLEKAGFRIRKIAKPGSYFTFSYLASSLAMYYPIPVFKALYRWVERTSLKDMVIPVNLYDIMTVYAEKVN